MVFDIVPKTFVAPRVGAWIEIGIGGFEYAAQRVAPRVGAWIEISSVAVISSSSKSRPVWARGLKSEIIYVAGSITAVAPRVGAWIEMRFLGIML